MAITQIRERDVEQYLLKQCRAHNLLCLKFTSPGRAGVPDRIIVGSGSTVFVEIKAPGCKPRPLQLATFAKIEAFGGRVFVVDSFSEIDELMSLLK